MYHLSPRNSWGNLAAACNPHRALNTVIVDDTSIHKVVLDFGGCEAFCICNQQVASGHSRLTITLCASA
jgi:hypothetical protein